MKVFSVLLELAKQPNDSQQVIAVKTAKANLYSFANDPLTDYDAEICFVQMLQDRDDSLVTDLVCLWSGGSVDLPSIHFRKRLLAAHPQNAQARMLVQGENGYCVRTIEKSL